jgi:hypothetical protein
MSVGQSLAVAEFTEIGSVSPSCLYSKRTTDKGLQELPSNGLSHS